MAAIWDMDKNIQSAKFYGKSDFTFILWFLGDAIKSRSSNEATAWNISRLKETFLFIHNALLAYFFLFFHTKTFENQK